MNAKMLIGLAAFVFLVSIATNQVALGLGAAIAAVAVIELLTLSGVLGFGRHD